MPKPVKKAPPKPTVKKAPPKPIGKPKVVEAGNEYRAYLRSFGYADSWITDYFVRLRGPL